MSGKQPVIDDQQRLEENIAQAIVQMLAMPQTLEQIRQSLSEQDKRIAQLEEAQALQGQSLQRSEGLVQEIITGMEAFYRRQQCMDRASESLSTLSQQHYRRHIIDPLVRRIFPLVDMLAEASPKGDGEQAMGNESDVLEAFAADLCELLAGYGVEPIPVAAGSAFDPKTMQPVRFVPTLRPKDDKTVEAVARQGFRCDDRILRSAMVSIYRFDGSKRIAGNPTQER